MADEDIPADFINKRIEAENIVDSVKPAQGLTAKIVNVLKGEYGENPSSVIAQEKGHIRDRMAGPSGGIVDATGRPIEVSGEIAGIAVGMAADGFVHITLEENEFERLSAKTAEILNESALAHERMAKDQEEIEQLKMETRALLKRLRAA
jgi:hypothetical protein